MADNPQRDLPHAPRRERVDTGSVTDNAGNTASATASGINIDLTAPTITASASPGPNGNDWNNTAVTVSYTVDAGISGVDAGASSFGDDTLSGEGANQSATGSVTDNAGNTASATASGINIDLTAPVISVSLDPATLWPPNHKLVDVTATVDSGDDTSGVDSITLVSATSNEPDNGTGDGDTADDIQGADIGTEDYELQLRAERSGGGSGRTYTVTYEATDLAGNTATASATATVAHSQKGGKGKGKK